jgi:hypothetical protein
MKPITFVHSSHSEMKIEVTNEASAQNLAVLLNQIPGSGWKRQVEVADAPVVAAPVAAAPAVVIPFSGENRRKEDRVEKELRVILLSGSSTFRCTTCDVSMGGVKLKAAVPETFCVAQCKAYLSKTGAHENIEVECRVIKDANGVSRLQFVGVSTHEAELLKAWL